VRRRTSRTHSALSACSAVNTSPPPAERRGRREDFSLLSPPRDPTCAHRDAYAAASSRRGRGSTSHAPVCMRFIA
jgi:hypothetical protein